MTLIHLIMLLTESMHCPSLWLPQVVVGFPGALMVLQSVYSDPSPLRSIGHTPQVPGSKSTKQSLFGVGTELHLGHHVQGWTH